MSQAQVFQSFNEQLACIADAGIPLDEGLRLIARETRSRKGRSAIERVVTGLEHGEDMSAAFAREAGSFPELYHRVIEVGVRSGRMSQVLISFGRHLSLIARFRSQLWRSMAYPIVCLVMLLLVATFLALGPIPILAGTAKSFAFPSIRTFSRTSYYGDSMQLSIITAVAPAVPYVCAAVLLVLVLLPVLWYLLGKMKLQSRFTEGVLFRIPLIGGVLSTAALARWCDALAICTEAGMNLPESIELSGKLLGYPRFTADSKEMVEALQSGAPLTLTPGGQWRQVTPSIRMALQLAAERQDLPHTARALAEMYQQQAERRAVGVGAILSPALLIVIALMIAVVLGALMVPLVQVLRTFML